MALLGQLQPGSPQSGPLDQLIVSWLDVTQTSQNTNLTGSQSLVVVSFGCWNLQDLQV